MLITVINALGIVGEYNMSTGLRARYFFGSRLRRRPMAKRIREIEAAIMRSEG